MSSVTRPRGPLPRRVYWTRRAVVLGVALLLVFGVAQVLGGGSDGKDTPKAQTVAGSPTITPSPTPTAEKTRKKTNRKGKKRRQKAATPAVTPTPPPLAEPSGPCTDSDVVVTASVEGARAGGDVTITLNVTTKVSEACTFDVSPESVVLRLTSGSDRIWTSQQCPSAIPTVTVVARRAVPGTATVTWNGQRSNDQCNRTAPWALPGYYHATAAALGSDPTDVQFLLAPPETRTVTPKPKIRTPKRTP